MEGSQMRGNVLFGLAPHLLAAAFPRQGLLCAAFVSRFQIIGMLLDILDDIFLLDFPLETTKRALD